MEDDYINESDGMESDSEELDSNDDDGYDPIICSDEDDSFGVVGDWAN